MDIAYIKVNTQLIVKRSLLQIRLFFLKNFRQVIGGIFITILLMSGWWLFNRKREVILKGEKFGQVYTIEYFAKRGKKYQAEIDSLLTAIVQALENGLADSEVTQFNDPTCVSLNLKSPFLYDILTKTKVVYEQTRHIFDPTVVPLVALWHRGLTDSAIPSVPFLQQVQEWVGLDYIVVNEKRAKKLKEGVQLDFNSLLPSYAVDVIAALLEKKGIKQYDIRIGNSALMGGQPAKKRLSMSHTIPSYRATDQPLVFYIALSDKASVRVGPIHREKGAIKPLIINPLSGEIAEEDVLDVLVFAKDCTTAYGIGIAIVAKGFKDAVIMLASMKNVSALIVYKNKLNETLFYGTPDLSIEQKELSTEFYIKFLENLTNTSSVPAPNKN